MRRGKKFFLPVVRAITSGWGNCIPGGPKHLIFYYLPEIERFELFSSFLTLDKHNGWKGLYLAEGATLDWVRKKVEGRRLQEFIEIVNGRDWFRRIPYFVRDPENMTETAKEFFGKWLTNGYELRVVADLGSILRKTRNPELIIEYERLVNELVHKEKLKVKAICAYNLRKVSSSERCALLESHDVAVKAVGAQTLQILSRRSSVFRNEYVSFPSEKFGRVKFLRTREKGYFIYPTRDRKGTPLPDLEPIKLSEVFREEAF